MNQPAAGSSTLILTYRYRIKDRSARKALSAYAEAVNQVWNYCVAEHKHRERMVAAGLPKRRWTSEYGLNRLTAGTSAMLGVHSQTIQLVCQQFTVSRSKAGRAPKYRASRGPRRSLGWVPFERQSRKIEGNVVTYLGKSFRFFGALARPVPATAKGGCFAEDASGRWWLCVHVEIGAAAPRSTGSSIGIDLGLIALATLSDGTSVPALKSYARLEARLATAQRAGKKRRARAIHRKIANARRDHIHKATTRIASKHRWIAIGNLSPAWLSKTRMAKSASDAAWSMFRQQLRYKASRHGAILVETHEAFTSATCSDCGERSGPTGYSGLRMREWSCGYCGATHDRDVNAARNILALSAQRRVDGSRAPNRTSRPLRIGPSDAI